ncbi:actin-related protein 10-like [Branchiostoma lanceolatum]|uniref:actin-related protein 10-like n=1 Tax=Branchiostoma lanceolatum TaxID=7740 RepID=UPI0034538B95
MPLFETIGLGGEKTAVVIDIGTSYTKLGFAGECGPRAIIPSEVKILQTGKVVRLEDYYNTNQDELFAVLVEFLHQMYFRYLLINPRDRRVLIAESVLVPTSFRDTLAKVFFRHFEVPSVMFAPSHMLTLLTLGINTALVMDVGYADTLVLPIYEGVAVLGSWQSLPLGGRAIHKRLESLLLAESTVATEGGSELPLSSIVGTVQEEMLEDIKVRTCFVCSMERSRKVQDAAMAQLGLIDPSQAGQPPTPPPSVEFPLDGAKILKINGSIRESSTEVLFEQDNELQSVATLILDAIIKSPIDTRKELAENLVVTGGTALLPGFMHRLMQELNTLRQSPKYSSKLAFGSFKIHNPPAQPNCVPWLGGAIFAATEALASHSFTKDIQYEGPHIPDWCSLNNKDFFTEGVVEKTPVSLPTLRKTLEAIKSSTGLGAKGGKESGKESGKGSAATTVKLETSGESTT